AGDGAQVGGGGDQRAHDGEDDDVLLDALDAVGEDGGQAGVRADLGLLTGRIDEQQDHADDQGRTLGVQVDAGGTDRDGADAHHQLADQHLQDEGDGARLPAVVEGDGQGREDGKGR